MALLTKAVRGTADILPGESYKWQHVENVLTKMAQVYGYREIRLPVFEHTELFTRSVGETTDVVQKEMYTFKDKGGRSITLRPEGTAGVMRAILEHGMLNEALPLKLYYLVSCYRYEKPQSGRYREFHQFGVEMAGSALPAADAEVISMAAKALDMLQIGDVTLEINSIGCSACRPQYHKALRDYFSLHLDTLCDTCKDRLQRNPMRILDCKSPVCGSIAGKAPAILDYICDDCNGHFEQVQQWLDLLGIPYVINPKIVRGLDYYNRTVFEFISKDIGAQGTVCAGGRFDGLIEELGGKPTPCLGFAMGIERILLLMKNKGIEFPPPPACDIYIASVGDKAAKRAFKLTAELRDEGFCVQCDISGRSLKAQMKYADKIGARYSLVLGQDEIDSGKAEIKDMQSGQTREATLDQLAQTLYNLKTDCQLANLTDKIGRDLLDMLGGKENG